MCNALYCVRIITIEGAKSLVTMRRCKPPLFTSCAMGCMFCKMVLNYVVLPQPWHLQHCQDFTNHGEITPYFCPKKMKT